MTYVVESAAVQVVAGARAHFIERGAVVPEGVDGDVIARLLSEGMISELPVEEETDEEAPVVIPEGDPTEKWTVAELEAFAADKGIDLSGPNKKPEKLAAILEAIKQPSA
jgi:hypothetical protein